MLRFKKVANIETYPIQMSLFELKEEM